MDLALNSMLDSNMFTTTEADLSSDMDLQMDSGMNSSLNQRLTHESKQRHLDDVWIFVNSCSS